MKLHICLLMILSFVSLGFSQGISGSVFLMDSEERIPNVKVEIIHFDSVINTIYTDFDGNFEIKNLYLGFYNIRFSEEGSYSQLVRNVGVFPNKISKVNILDFEYFNGNSDSIEFIEILKDSYLSGENIGSKNMEFDCFPDNLKPTEIPNYGHFSGIVTDLKTGESIPTANVVLKRQDVIITGTATDFDGFFQLDSIPIGYYQIEISFIGYITHKIKSHFIGPGENSALNISLDEEAVDKIIKIYSCGPILFDTDKTSEIFDARDIIYRPF